MNTWRCRFSVNWKKRILGTTINEEKTQKKNVAQQSKSKAIEEKENNRKLINEQKKKKLNHFRSDHRPKKKLLLGGLKTEDFYREESQWKNLHQKQANQFASITSRHGKL